MYSEAPRNRLDRINNQTKQAPLQNKIVIKLVSDIVLITKDEIGSLWTRPIWKYVSEVVDLIKQQRGTIHTVSEYEWEDVLYGKEKLTHVKWKPSSRPLTLSFGNMFPPKIRTSVHNLSGLQWASWTSFCQTLRRLYHSRHFFSGKRKTFITLKI